jgi:hypothetical protein
MTKPVTSDWKDADGCGCFAEVNAMLREHNAELNVNLFDTVPKVFIATLKLDKKKRGNPPHLQASYCPFCGAHYPAKERAA